MDWRAADQSHEQTIPDQLRDAKAAGVVALRLASGTVDPRRLSYEAAGRVARRDAEHVVNEAINREAETERKRRARA